jgi:hypothetical protein
MKLHVVTDKTLMIMIIIIVNYCWLLFPANLFGYIVFYSVFYSWLLIIGLFCFYILIVKLQNF